MTPPVCPHCKEPARPEAIRRMEAANRRDESARREAERKAGKLANLVAKS